MSHVQWNIANFSKYFSSKDTYPNPFQFPSKEDAFNIIGKFENDNSQKLAIPLVGHSYYKKTRFDFHIQKVLFDEAVSTKDFFIKELQEVSIDGGFRNASSSCTNYSLDNNIVNFTLSRGSFATIVLREIMKPDEPLLAGF